MKTYFVSLVLSIAPYPEDEDATDGHSEVIANEHIQDNLLGLKQ